MPIIIEKKIRPSAESFWSRQSHRREIPRKIRFVRKSGMHVMARNLTWEDGQTVI